MPVWSSSVTEHVSSGTMSSLWMFLALSLVVASESACPKNWVHHGGSCYRVRPAASWYDAKIICDVLNARILEVDSYQENAFIAKLTKHLTDNWGVWMGLHDMSTEGRFVLLSTGQPPEFSNFRRGEPNNSGGSEDCVILQHFHKQWTDMACHRKEIVICEKREVLREY